MSTIEDTVGPYVCWVNYGCEGWQPRSWGNIADAIICAGGYEFVIQKPVKYEIIEKDAIEA